MGGLAGNTPGQARGQALYLVFVAVVLRLQGGRLVDPGRGKAQPVLHKAELDGVAAQRGNSAWA